VNSEIRPLTGVRGIAALVVVLYHFGEPYHTLGIQTHFRIHQGYLAVDLFFVLSGFVLAYNYADYFAANFSLQRFWHFFIRRIARLYPAYFAITCLYLMKMAVNFAGDNPFDSYRFSDIPGNLFMLTGWGLGIKPVVGDSWSVSAELGAYLLFPFLVPFAVYGRSVGIAATALLAGAAWVVIAASGLGVKGPMDVVSNESLYPLLRCIAGFSLGLLAFSVWRNPSARRLLSGNVPTLVLLILFGICLMIHAHDLVVLAFFPVFILVLGYESGIARALFANRVVMWLGEISYSLYLVHISCVGIMVRAAKAAETQFGTSAYGLLTVVGVSLSCGLAWVCFRWIEMPGKRLVLGLVQPRSARVI